MAEAGSAMLRHCTKAAARSSTMRAPVRCMAEFYGHSPVKVDPSVEKYAAHREDIETTFEFTPKNNLRLAIFAIAVPLGFYAMTKGEMVESDREWGSDKTPNTRGNTRGYL